MNKLLPCPLCGGDPLYGYNGDVNWIECLVCGLSTAFYGKAFAVEYVEEKWNTRHTPEGWTLVPDQPTDEMADAAFEADSVPVNYGHWIAMLAAAPKWGGE